MLITPVAIEKRLRSGPLPGAEAQYRLAPEHRAGPEFAVRPPADAREAGVLILLFPHEGALLAPMIQRPLESGPHSGQISFPGGGREPLDESLARTALRETWEEIGAPAGDIRLLGELSPLYVAPSNFLVQPFVGWTDARPAYTPDPREVAAVLEFAIADFLAPENLKTADWIVRGVRVRAPHFVINGHTIWGASAMIWSEFLEVLRSLAPAAGQRQADGPP